MTTLASMFNEATFREIIFRLNILVSLEASASRNAAVEK